MSVENLIFMYNQINRGCPRNIDCGVLRRIGKTSCIKQLIQNSHRNYQENIVLVPSTSFSQVYRDIAPTFVVSPWLPIEVSRMELLQTLRGADIRYFIYADEVRNAEEIVEGLDPRRAIFEVGFYSMPYDQRRRIPERTRSERERLTRYEQLTFDELRSAERYEIAERRQQLSFDEIRRAEQLISNRSITERLKPNFFETSWVQNPAPPPPPTSTIETKKNNVKMKFIT